MQTDIPIPVESVIQESPERIELPMEEKRLSIQVHIPRFPTLKLAGSKSVVPILNLENIRKPFTYTVAGIEQECLGDSLSNYSLSSVRMANMWRPINIFEEHMQKCLRKANNLHLFEDVKDFNINFDKAFDDLFEPQSVIIEDKIQLRN